ncbi:MAG: type I methionyl aminopeptidase [Malacoplasma sp.]|nr:type I methionyl aminopeptidase [Malacoplasma sp.]
MIILKSKFEIEQIKKACQVWKIVKRELIKNSVVNKSLIELDKIAYETTIANNCKAPFYQYNGFSGYNCISVNEIIIHNIPNNYKLKNGDLVTYDVGIEYEGYICDAAFSLVIGANAAAEKINQVCYQSLMAGIAQIKPNNRVGDISAAIQNVVESNGYFLLKNFGGHGCGRFLHEDPMILNYGKPHTGPVLKPNMVLCIEPMIMTESDAYYIDKNKWSVIAKNKKLTCHWEHMVLVTNDGCEILTE